MKVLLALKADYKSATGKDWKPGADGGKISAVPSGGSGINGGNQELEQKIADQGGKVRDLKSKKASKVVCVFLPTCIEVRDSPFLVSPAVLFSLTFLPVSSYVT